MLRILVQVEEGMIHSFVVYKNKACQGVDGL